MCLKESESVTNKEIILLSVVVHNDFSRPTFLEEKWEVNLNRKFVLLYSERRLLLFELHTIFRGMASNMPKKKSWQMKIDDAFPPITPNYLHWCALCSLYFSVRKSKFILATKNVNWHHTHYSWIWHSVLDAVDHLFANVALITFCNKLQFLIADQNFLFGWFTCTVEINLFKTHTRICKKVTIALSSFTTVGCQIGYKVKLVWTLVILE